MEYDVIRATELHQLIAEVNERLKEGWQLQGGIGVMKDLSYPYYQAMVRGHSATH